MNLFLTPTCCGNNPCRIISIFLVQPNIRKIADKILNAPILGSCERPLFLYSLPEMEILSFSLNIIIGTFPLGAFRMFCLNAIMSLIEVKGLNTFGFNIFPRISTPKVSKSRVPKI